MQSQGRNQQPNNMGGISMPSQPLNTDDLATLEKYLESRIAATQETVRAAYPSRAELLGLMDKINERITCLEISKATLEGKASQRDVYRAEIIGGLGLIIGLVGLIISILGM